MFEQFKETQRVIDEKDSQIASLKELVASIVEPLEKVEEQLKRCDLTIQVLAIQGNAIEQAIKRAKEFTNV